MLLPRIYVLAEPEATLFICFTPQAVLPPFSFRRRFFASSEYYPRKMPHLSTTLSLGLIWSSLRKGPFLAITDKCLSLSGQTTNQNTNSFRFSYHPQITKENKLKLLWTNLTNSFGRLDRVHTSNNSSRWQWMTNDIEMQGRLTKNEEDFVLLRLEPSSFKRSKLKWSIEKVIRDCPLDFLRGNRSMLGHIKTEMNFHQKVENNELNISIFTTSFERKWSSLRTRHSFEPAVVFRLISFPFSSSIMFIFFWFNWRNIQTKMSNRDDNWWSWSKISN